MQKFQCRFRTLGKTVSILLCLLLVLLIPAASGADADIVATLGDTIALHGFSYVGDKVFLFMTGPGLPANGVTLTNTALRADQGQFTIVGLDDNQEWTYLWKTSRIDSEIDPGTYTVYVTNEPVDFSHLGGSSSYKTLVVMLSESNEPKISIGAEHVYTLNPEENDSTPFPAPLINITSATATTNPIPTTTATTVPIQTTVPTTRSANAPLTAVISLLSGVCLVSFLKHRP